MLNFVRELPGAVASLIGRRDPPAEVSPPVDTTLVVLVVLSILFAGLAVVLAFTNAPKDDAWACARSPATCEASR